MGGLQRLIDAFASGATEDALLRSRVLAAAALAVLPGGAVYAAVAWFGAGSAFLAASALAWIPGGIAILVAMRRGVPTNALAVGVVALTWATTAAFRHETGGLASPAAATVAIVPLLAAFFIGVRAAAAVTALLIAEVALLVAFAPPAAAPVREIWMPALIVGDVTFWAFVLAWLFEVQTRRARQELQEAEDRLRHADRMAVAGRLAAGLAHEVSNPLTIANAGLGALRAQLDRDEPDLGSLSATLGQVEDAQRRATQAVRGLGDYARTGQDEHTAVDLASVGLDAVGLVRVLLQERGVWVETELPPELPVAGSGTQLEQVVVNLLMNASEACAGGGRVVVRGRAEDDTVRLDVIDDGPGVPDEAMDRLFEPFFTTKPPGEGVGLGLSISAGIVADHGGRIEVDSSPGGTTFSVVLPAAATPG